MDLRTHRDASLCFEDCRATQTVLKGFRLWKPRIHAARKHRTRMYVLNQTCENLNVLSISLILHLRMARNSDIAPEPEPTTPAFAFRLEAPARRAYCSTTVEVSCVLPYGLGHIFSRDCLSFVRPHMRSSSSATAAAVTESGKIHRREEWLISSRISCLCCFFFLFFSRAFLI